MEPSQQIIFNGINAVTRKSSPFMNISGPGLSKFEVSNMFGPGLSNCRVIAEHQTPTPDGLMQPISNDKFQARVISVPFERCFQGTPETPRDSCLYKATPESSVNSRSSKQILPQLIKKSSGLDHMNTVKSPD